MDKMIVLVEKSNFICYYYFVSFYLSFLYIYLFIWLINDLIN